MSQDSIPRTDECKIEIAGERDLPDWQCFVDSRPDAGPYHHAGWLSVLKESTRVSRRRFLTATESHLRPFVRLVLVWQNERPRGRGTGEQMESARKPQVCIVVPCYNEGSSIGSVLTELSEATAARSDVEWEVIVVDDASTDNSREEVEKFPGVRLICHPENHGYGASIKTGIKATEASLVLTMDADGQHIPHEISKLIDASEGYDMVVGARVGASSRPPLRRPGTRLISMFLNLILWRKVPDFNSGFRLFRRQTAMNCLHLLSDRFSFSTSLTLALFSENYFVRYVPIDIRKRTTDQSHVSAFDGLKTILRILRIVMFFHPLRLVLPVVVIAGTAGGASLIYDLCARNITDMTILLILASIQFLFFGLMADQIAQKERN